MAISTHQQAAVHESVERLLAEHRALRKRLEQLEAQIAQIPTSLENSSHATQAGRNPSMDAPLGDDPHNLRGRARYIGDLVSPVDVEWDAER